MELLFWKSVRDAGEVVDGYDRDSSRSTARQKASYWSEEDEEKLERFFHQFKEMAEKDPSEDILENLATVFIETRRTKRQIARKLREMQLITVRVKNFLYWNIIVTCLIFTENEGPEENWRQEADCAVQKRQASSGTGRRRRRRRRKHRRRGRGAARPERVQVEGVHRLGRRHEQRGRGHEAKERGGVEARGSRWGRTRQEREQVHVQGVARVQR